MSAGPRAVDHLGNSYMQFLFDQSKFNSPSGTAFSLKMPKLSFISLGTTGNGYCLQKTPIRGGSLPNFPRGETTKVYGSPIRRVGVFQVLKRSYRRIRAATSR
jgi:hypothetical protein